MKTTGFEPSIIQDNRIQKLCKRLSRFTLEDISLIAELEEFEVKSILQNLTKENILSLHNKHYVYNVQKEAKLKKRLPLMFEFQSKETIAMIIKCFCAEISCEKAGLILNPEKNCISDFNTFFRKLLYKNQKISLEKYFRNNPQKPRLRRFFNQTFYFYYYNGSWFVSDERLDTENAQIFSKQEIKEFKIIYSWLCRRLSHNGARFYPECHIAEQLWRYKKEYNLLKQELTRII